MLVHCRVFHSIKFAGTHFYTGVERGTVRVKCLAQEHNTMSPTRAQTRNARSGVEHTNHEATAPPILGEYWPSAFFCMDLAVLSLYCQDSGLIFTIIIQLCFLEYKYRVKLVQITGICTRLIPPGGVKFKTLASQNLGKEIVG